MFEARLISSAHNDPLPHPPLPFASLPKEVLGSNWSYEFYPHAFFYGNVTLDTNTKAVLTAG